MASSAVNTQGLTPATPANPDSKSSSEVASPLITTSPLITLSPQFSGSAFTHPPLSTGASLNSAALPADSLSDLAAPRVEAPQPTLISGRLPTLPPGRLESNYDKAKKLIAAKAASLSRIGAAKGDVKHETAGYYQAYADAIIMAATDASGVPHNAVEVQGDIMRRYVSIGGGHSFFGYPISDETSTPDGACRYSLFQNGAGIFWTPATGACLLYGAIYQKFVALGGVYSSLSYPLNSESAAGSKGRFNDFQNGASIYWSGATGACLIYGEIHKKWSDLGGVQSFLGLPSTDETGAGSRGGRFNDFEGGSIYWSPYTGTHEQAGPLPAQLDYNLNYVFPAGTALGGWNHITIYSNGSYQFSGHFHDSGSVGYDYSVANVIVDADNQPFAFAHQGHAAGTFGSGSRDNDWNSSAVNAAIADEWRAIVARPNMQGMGKTTVDWTGLINTLVEVVNKAVGIAQAVAGVISIFA